MSYESEKRQINIVSVVILALSVIVAYLLFTMMNQKVKIEVAHQQIEQLETNLDVFSKSLNNLAAKQNVYMNNEIPAPISLDTIGGPQLDNLQGSLDELNSSLNIVDDMMKVLDELAVKAQELEEAEARGEDVSEQMEEISKELKMMEESMMEMTGLTPDKISIETEMDPMMEPMMDSMDEPMMDSLTEDMPEEF